MTAAVSDPDALMVPTAAERDDMIAIAAYFLAERRGFVPGAADDDWLRAEQQIDRMLESMRRRGVTRAQFERAGIRNALQLWSRDPRVTS
jgi:hypothetical protein